jgi:glutaredoxin-related protein
MTYVKLKNVTKLFADDQSNTHVGIPTAITATGNKYLALGTSMGNIALF